ncbi:integrase [Calothrix sp. 336/3]|uniref:integrase n=1 Tax=Calothrix sp. 336/3 TaxID=1337936 RepID=UPI0004E40448|nr:integrase [Calothrix sp. 336/3]AKG21266.1 integrase [Calothrix sp. 336/3]
MSGDTDDRIASANARLKAANVKLIIEPNGGKLSLRGTLPQKNGEGNKQQRIPLNITATADGIKQAESEAHAIRRDLNAGRFNWDSYIHSEPLVEHPKLILIKDWLEAFEADYFNRREKNQKSLTTWYGDYHQVFKHLPQNKKLTEENLRRVILTTAPDTKNRKRYCNILGALTKFAGLDCNFRNLSGNYSPKKVTPRDIPSDADIVNWYEKLVNPAWRWAYGVLATYGLRNHEVFRLDYERLKTGDRVLSVLDGKTGARRVWAIYPEWFDTFDLSNVLLPKANLSRTDAQLGNNVTHYFVRHGLPFSAYDLRHAWAIRSLEFGLDITLASQQMGHALKVHSETYHHWISERHHQRAYDLLTTRSDRPKPPNFR